MSQSRIILLFVILGFFTCCSESKDERPTDQEMISNFNSNQSAFVRLQTIISDSMPGDHYPAYENDPDSLRLSMLSKEKKALLDSLLQVVGIERIFYTGIDAQPEFVQDTIHSKRIDFLYYSYGLSVSGGSKEYVYAPYLKERISQTMTSNDLKYSMVKIVNEDLDELSKTYSQNIELYRPIKGDWYICLERDN